MMRDGTESADPRLDRLIEFDERSRSYPIRTLVAGKPQRSYTWAVGAWLDQGAEGACVGFAWAHELCARPRITMVPPAFAREQIYHEAQKIDPWPGGDYPGANPRYEGTSVLAGAKVCQGLGHFKEYRWAFSLEDLVLAIGYAGPAVLGIPWYEGMSEPFPDGCVWPTGSVMGGHAILAYRVQVKTAKRDVPKIWLHNSWGQDWGVNGTCWLTFDDMQKLLNEDGEACIPVKRQPVVWWGKSSHPAE